MLRETMRHLTSLILTALLLAGCVGSQPPPAPASPTPSAPIATSTTSPSPTPPRKTPTVSPSPTPQPTEAPQLLHETPDFTIALPPGWQPVALGQHDAEEMFAAIQEGNPQWARIIGSAGALVGAALWAFDGDTSAAAFVDNLNIQRAPLDGEQPEDLQVVLEALLAEYSKQGLKDAHGRAGLNIGGYPALHTTYELELDDTTGAPVTVHGYQYLVATDTDVWVLSYTVQLEELESLLTQSAESFRPK